MAKQASDASSSLESMRIPGPQTQSERDATLATVNASTAALLTSRDQLDQHGTVPTLQTCNRQLIR